MTRIIPIGTREVVVASLIGIDTHKDSLTCYAVDELGKELESVHAVNDGRGFRKVERFASRFRATRVGIECSGSYGLRGARSRPESPGGPQGNTAQRGYASPQ